MPFPLLLAGPLLRRVEPRLVSVWVALSRQCRIGLTVWQGAQIASTSVEPLGALGMRRSQSPGGWERTCLSLWSQ